MTYVVTNTEMTTFIILIVWELVWKGLALWRAAKIHQPIWFVIILMLNTAGILPIIYLLTTNAKVKTEEKSNDKSNEFHKQLFHAPQR